MAETCEASTTLLCLNGLKSSLMWTGVLFLKGRVPKKGLGVEGLNSDLGLGETDAEADGVGFGEAEGFATGLNEEALTFNLFAAVFGDTGV
jgi:uncharacterized protein with LGFP repeats